MLFFHVLNSPFIYFVAKSILGYFRFKLPKKTDISYFKKVKYRY
ncbi:hypothetical protein HMPREF9087_1666, partial [Enterococcus casseliflavus ATCC 12755]